MQIFQAYNSLKALTIEFNIILKRLLECPKHSKYYQSPEYTVLLDECLQYLKIISDADLVAIIVRHAIK